MADHAARSKSLRLLCLAVLIGLAHSESALTGRVLSSPSLAEYLDSPLDLSTVLIEVTPQEGPRLRVRCATDGSFLLAVPNGKHSVRAASRGNLAFSSNIAEVACEAGSCNGDEQLEFTVTGFILTGRVVDASGHPMSGVDILTGDIILGTTNSQGKYKFVNVKPGRYSLQASKPRTAFSSIVNHEVKAGDERLPDMVVQQVSICGKVQYKNDTFNTYRRVSVTSDDEKYIEVVEVQFGSYCIQVPPGNYKIAPSTTKEERAAGLVFKPALYTLRAREGVGHVDFLQEQTTLVGSVRCMKTRCHDRLRITVTEVATNKTVHRAYLSEITTGWSQNTTTFAFDAMGPGRYLLRAYKRGWCWEEEEVEALVTDNHGYAPTIVQTGVLLNITTDVDTTLELYSQATNEYRQRNISRGATSTCFPTLGKVNITPAGFFKFADSARNMVWDTDRHQSFNFTATAPCLYAFVELYKESSKPQHAGLKGHPPPRREGDPEKEEDRLQGPARVHVLHHSNGEWEEHTLFPSNEQHLWALRFPMKKFNDTVTLRPWSLMHIFDPPTINVTNDGNPYFPKRLMRLKGIPGSYKFGQVSPPVHGAFVSAVSMKNPELRVNATTNMGGQFVMGPIFDGQQYQVSVAKAGWQFHRQTHEKDFLFRAVQLGQVKVLVTSSDAAATAQAQVVLTGRGATKTAVLGSDAQHNFLGLEPAEYRLSLALEGFSFEPEGLEVKVQHGKQYTHKFKATRITAAVEPEMCTASSADSTAAVQESSCSADTSSVQQQSEPTPAAAPAEPEMCTADGAGAAAANEGSCSAGSSSAPQQSNAMPAAAPAEEPEMCTASSADAAADEGSCFAGTSNVRQQSVASPAAAAVEQPDAAEEPQQEPAQQELPQQAAPAPPAESAAEEPQQEAQQEVEPEAATTAGTASQPEAAATAAISGAQQQLQQALQAGLSAAAAALGFSSTASSSTLLLLLLLLGPALLLALRTGLLPDLLHLRGGKRISGAGVLEGGAGQRAGDGRLSGAGSSTSRSSSTAGADLAAAGLLGNGQPAKHHKGKKGAGKGKGKAKA